MIKASSKGTTKSQESPRVVDEALNNSTLDLVRKAASSFRWKTVRVKPLSRFGYSGARLLVIRPNYKRFKPHALKIAERKQVEREMRAIEACLPTVGKIRSPKRFDSDVRDDTGRRWSAICYEYFGDGTLGSPFDLTDIYSSCMGDFTTTSLETTEERLLPMLKNVLEQLSVAHQLDPDRDSKTHSDLFQWYLHPNRPNRVQRVLQGSNQFYSHGIAIERNPLDGIDSLLQAVSDGYRAVLIHGDLHLSNIVIDGDLSPNLVDFKWARRGGHLFLDYALLESSMRFMRFPHDIHPRVLLAVDSQLNADYFGGDAEHLVSRVRDTLTRHRLVQMHAATMFVRKQLAHTIGEWNTRHWLEYQKTLYLVLAGQQRLSSFPLMRTIINLHQLQVELEI